MLAQVTVSRLPVSKLKRQNSKDVFNLGANLIPPCQSAPFLLTLYLRLGLNERIIHNRSALWNQTAFGEEFPDMCEQLLLDIFLNKRILKSAQSVSNRHLITRFNAAEVRKCATVNHL